jgi:hypothetical protein
MLDAEGGPVEICIRYKRLPVKEGFRPLPVVYIIRTITWRDAADIIFLTIVAYQLFVWFRGTVP